ncbi:hypothetical protein [Micromonospora zhanjiangensis]|uniref:Hypoxia induced protein conserved region n=1 Tax=Micromonospora zhanjiangensis TaxID=1522057 RepID=A0ABV8KLA3_9ACTN
MPDLTFIVTAIMGVALLIAAVIRAGMSTWGWPLFRIRLSRLLTTALVVILFFASIKYVT